MLVRSHDGAIDMMQVPIQLDCGVSVPLQLGQDLVPNASSAPAIEAGGDRLPGTIVRGEIPPGSARAIQPEDATDDRAVVVAGPASSSFLRWKERPQPLPLLVGQDISCHTPVYSY
jgi:hypothetical protein